MRYVLGLDIGIASVGWCILNEDLQRIENLGVRTFTKAEHPKDGSPLAEPRRLARGMRRRIRRRAHRLERIRRLLVRTGFGTQVEIEANLEASTIAGKTPYDFRAEGLDRKLSKEEWAKALYHIATRRGFKSNRKSEENEKEGGKLLQGVRANAGLMEDKKYRTVGEMLAKDEKFSLYKRNKGGSYEHTLGRGDLLAEIELLFSRQRELGNPLTNPEFEESFSKIFAAQRHYASGDQVFKMIGHCTFENEKNGKENQPRAPKMGYSAERFALLTRLVNLRILRQGATIPLDEEQRRSLMGMAYETKKVTYKQARKKLGLEEEDRFNGLSYQSDKKDPEEGTLAELKGYHGIKKAVEGSLGKIAWLNLSQQVDQLNFIAEALTYYKTDEDIQKYLTEKEVPEEIQAAVLSLSFDRVIHLSNFALNQLLPHLESGKRYDEACTEVGYLHYSPHQVDQKKVLLPSLSEEMKNPVVRRTFAQTRKVVNAIIRKYGAPREIHVELARELNKPWDERQKIQKGQEEYQSQKEKAVQKFKEISGREPKGADLLKFRLWGEQDGFCAYSQEYIDPTKLVYDPTYTEVDHILPYSRSFDDSMSNKVLVKTVQNQRKGNRTPYEYFAPDQWNTFEVWVKTQKKLSHRKKTNLLRKNFGDAEVAEMRNRNLNDTRYISRLISNYMREHLAFHEECEKNPVRVLNGQLTAFLRARWGLLKNRSESDRHHALDAAVIAAASQRFVSRLSKHSKWRELWNIKIDENKYVDPETGEILDSPYRQSLMENEKFPQPWEHFREELLVRLSPIAPTEIEKLNLPSYREGIEVTPIFVSRAPYRNASGAAHQETIRSTRWLKSGLTSVKTPLAKLTLKNLEDMVGKERDWRLYEGLKERLEAFSGNGQKAFVEPFYKYRKDGTPGPIVRSIPLFSTGTAGVSVRQGIADNDRMVRVDVYLKDKKYHLVPYYIADIVNKTVKDKAIIAGKSEEEWTQINKTFQFQFSLYPNDLVRIVTKKETFEGYYRGTHRGTGNITFDVHDRDQSIGKKGTIEGIGVKTAQSFQKLQVDPLGNKSFVSLEKPRP